MKIDGSDVIGFLLLAPIAVILWALALSFVWEIVGGLL
jgi:hypothetical protein